MSNQGKSLEQIKREMNERWHFGDAYACALPWDLMRHDHLHGKVVDTMSKLLVDFCGDGPLKVVDLGCGTKTTFAKSYAADKMVKFKDIHLTLVDIAEEAIKKIREESGPVMAELWGGRLSPEYLACPAETMAKYLAPQHLIVSVESIEHWVDLEACLNGIREALLPGGYFLLTTPNRDSLHARMGRKLGFDVPFCANDHTYEFGYEELDSIMADAKFQKVAETGVGFAPYWALEAHIGPKLRQITDRDTEVIGWFQTIGERCPEFSFCQVKAFKRM